MKTISEIKEGLKKLIAEGELQEFFVEFNKVLNQKSTLYNDFVHLRSRYSRAVRNLGLGIISTKEIDVFLNQINSSFIQMIDRLKEKNISDQYQKVEALEENIATNSDFIKLKKEDLKFILDYNQDLEEILDHDFELFALLDVHHGYSNFMTLIEIRKVLMENPTEEQILRTINLVNFETTRKQFELDMPGTYKSRNSQKVAYCKNAGSRKC